MTLDTLPTTPEPMPPESEQDGGLEFEPDNLPRIPAGRYEAGCYKARKVFFRAFQCSKLRLSFEIITPGPQSGVKVEGWCALPKQGEKIGLCSKVYRWTVIALCRKPARRDRFTPRWFEGKIYKVLVKDTTRRIPGTDLPAPAAIQYSTVSELLEVLAGGQRQ